MTTAYQQTLTINRLTDLNELLRVKHQYSDIQFADGLVPDEPTDNIKRRLISYHNHCGCGSGGLFAVLVMVFAVPMIIGLHKLDYLNLWQSVSVGLFVMMCSVGVGKLVGQRRAKSALKLEIKRLLGN